MFIERNKLVPGLAFAIASSLCRADAAQEIPKPTEPAASAPAFRSAVEKPGSAAPDAGPPASPPATAQPVKGGDAATPTAPQPQTAPPPAEPPLVSGVGEAKPSPNVVINLINRMVKKGLLSPEEAAELIGQAEQDVIVARTQARDDAQIAAQIVVQQAVQQNVVPNLDPMLEDTVSVPYIPETVKKQIKDDLRQEVLADAKKNNYAMPKGLPEWVSRFRVNGDIRIRYERDFFPAGNDNTGSFPNFNAINTGPPYDVTGTVFAPQFNVDEDRTRIRIRARVGAEVDLGEGFTAGLRIGTGENNTPTSMNQSLGLANQGQGGNFSKYAIWLDRAFLRYEALAASGPARRVALNVGRFDNPFFSTDLVWDEDVGFDGIALQGSYAASGKITPFFTGGAFPVFNTDFNFASNQPSKFKSTDKYLYAGQIGATIKPARSIELKVAGAYYYFDGVSGKLSTPYTPITSSDAGDTDDTRPSFAQKGNTYMALRNIVPNANNNFGTINQWQYFGLASKFRPIVATARLDYNGFEPLQVSVTGEFVKNLAFDQTNIASKAVNNRGPVSNTSPAGNFVGGDTAWIVGLRAGHPALQERGNWQAGFNYRYLESDAVIDGFNDSDFGHGGTNQKGCTLWATYATSARTALTVRWMSANEVSGPPLKSDILMIDFSGRF
jgi:polyhydroxyalkanoate synthesis regulator phasin